MLSFQESKNAVTLIELIVLFVILGILATLALPMFGRTFEIARAKEAIAALQQIRTGERIYRSKDNFYYPHFSDHPAAESDIDTINNDLNIYLYSHAARRWNFSIDTSSAGDFSVIATRAGGAPAYNNKTIVIDQTGAILPFPASTWPLPLPNDIK